MLESYRLRHPGSGLAQIVFYDLWREAILLFFRVVYRHKRVGIDNIPRTGAVLVVANHGSYLDPPAVGCGIRRRQADYLARASLFKFKPFGWLITQLYSTPIKQGAGDAGAMKLTIQKMNEGKLMLVFPEGSRSDDGTLGEFQRGVAVLLKRAHCQIVPVGIAGAYEAWPRGRKFPRIFTKRIVVCYGEPISSDELMSNGTDQALSDLRDRVAQLMAVARSHQ